jgi:hypothetical protein
VKSPLLDFFEPIRLFAYLDRVHSADRSPREFADCRRAAWFAIRSETLGLGVVPVCVEHVGV